MSLLENDRYVDHMIEGMLELSHEQEMEFREKLEKIMEEGPSAEEMNELDLELANEEERNS